MEGFDRSRNNVSVRIVQKLILAALCILFGATLYSNEVKADLIFTPADSFFEEHEQECEYIQREFITTGPNGEVIVYESPVSDKVKKVLSNGETFCISFVYRDSRGIQWGVYDEDGTIGWLPMDYMTVVYDYISFAEDYGTQFVTENGQIDAAYGGTEIYCWNYPGSEEGYTIKPDGDNLPSYSCIYVDEQGRTWGFCDYYYGMRNRWFCLDALTADYEALYAESGAPIIPKTDPAQQEVYEGAPIVPENNPMGKYIKAAILLVIVVVTITFSLFCRLCAKYRKFP